MKRPGSFPGAMVVFGLLAWIAFGCGDTGTTSPSNLSTRVNLLYAENGILTPVVQTAEGGRVSASDQRWEYTLTLENLKNQVLWYTDRPGRESGSEALQTYLALWSGMYGEVSPNAILDVYVRGATSNDGLFLVLENPLYDAGADRLTFHAIFLDTTIDTIQPGVPIYMDQIKITVLDNSPKDETDAWSFAQVAPNAFFEPTGTKGVFKLYLEQVYPESYYIGNAPNRRSYLYTVSNFVRNWREIFQDDPPNASITSYTDEGVLKVHMLTLDTPEYDTDTRTVIYTATLLHGAIQNRQPLYSPTLFIDKVAASGRHAIQVHNNCTETIWLGACGNCKTQQSPCPEYFDPPQGANVEMDAGSHIVFHVDQGWAGRFWPRTGCKFNKDGKCDSGDCCDAGGCVNKDQQFARDCYYSGNPPVLVIEPTFDAPSGNGPIDYFDTSMVDGYNVLMSIEAIANTYNPSPDPGMDSKYWCTTAGCSSSPACPEFLKDGVGNCWSPCQHAVRTGLPTAEQEKLCCSCDMTAPCTCPDPCCDGHYGCSPYVKDTSGQQKYPPNMCCDPWGKLNNNRPWDQKYIDYIEAVKKACPEVYSWQFDDFKSTINCRKTNGLVDYKLTICP
ncbi:MAG: hypothetical protein JRL30_05100 [Deltaproteobacteria bacterium]|nr:hypothetical protein [Deltaproteobacteria bacterium]